MAGLANILPFAFESKLIKPRCPCDPSEVPPFDRSVIGNDSQLADSLSDASLGVLLVSPVILDLGDLGFVWTQPLKEDLVVYLETLAINGALASLAKYTVQRPIPRLYANQDPSLLTSPDGYHAFYSGHTSFAFAALSAASMTYELRHGASLWPWITTAVLGTSVGVERILAGRHFYSDVLVGAVAGTAVGTLVPWLHRRKSEFKIYVWKEGLALAWQHPY